MTTPTDADSGFTPENIADAEWLWLHVAADHRKFHDLPTHHKALICHTAARHREEAEKRGYQRAVDEIMAWQPIKTAPQSLGGGRAPYWMLVWRRGNALVACKEDDGTWTAQSGCPLRSPPDYWMPLQPPPSGDYRKVEG